MSYYTFINILIDVDHIHMFATLLLRHRHGGRREPVCFATHMIPIYPLVKQLYSACLNKLLILKREMLNSTIGGTPGCYSLFLAGSRTAGNTPQGSYVDDLHIRLHS